MVFHWNLSDIKSLQVFRTLLNNAVVWMVNSSPYFQPLQSLYQSFGDCQEHQLKLVSPSLSYSTDFLKFFNKVQVYIFLFAFFQIYFVVSRDC